ncbi:MAG TPA: quinolinate synthase NadA [Bacteroidales bacterium]|nr:quinolinate synthase NadA [Bacteroidales bacterium]
MNYQEKILELKKQKNAIILAHFYQLPEIQEIADHVEDSLGLSQKAANTDANIIVFCGVKFMAETAKILNPEKKVLIPDINAGCSLADSCEYKDLKKLKEKYPDHIIVSYINCSAEVKTLSDIICTSGNALDIISSIPADKPILFAPDKNLGSYINKITGRNMLLWDGICKVHDILKAEEIIRLKIENRDAELIAHPECQASVLELADFVGSTAAMLKYIKKNNSKKYIVATESGIIHQMKKAEPEKQFIIVAGDKSCNCNDCEYMKLTTLEKLFLCLQNEEPEITLDKKTIEKAGKPLFKMLEISAAAKK